LHMRMNTPADAKSDRDLLSLRRRIMLTRCTD
jgi:hypothetical protein